jgi:transposase-like protein
MPSKKHKPEEIIGEVREVEIVLGQGGTTAEACRRIAVSEQTCYRWRKEYGGLKTDQHEGFGEGEPAAPPRDLRSDTRQAYPSGGRPGKLLSPAPRRRCIDQLRRELPVSERRICRVVGQHRSTHRKVPRGADDEQQLTEDIIALAKQYGRYGDRRVAALVRHAGWTVNRKRVERIWRK